MQNKGANYYYYYYLTFIVLVVRTQVDAMWEQMNKGVSSKTLMSFLNKPSPNVNKISSKMSNVRVLCLFWFQWFRFVIDSVFALVIMG